MQRRTVQRELVRKAFVATGRPLSVAEAHEIAVKERPSLGVATVYRAVADMVECGELQPVDLPGQAGRYECTGLGHHHHFHCRNCDRVYDIDGCALRQTVKLPQGFRVQQHEVIFYGLCPSCAG